MIGSVAVLVLLCCLGGGAAVRAPSRSRLWAGRARWSKRHRSRATARRRREAVAATELLAACLAAGASPVRAAEAAAEVLDGQAAHVLAAAAAGLRRGEPPDQCWAGLAVVPELAGVGRILARTSVSGTRAAAAIGVEAAGLRARSRAAAQAALSRVGVWAVAPLALCFLPAFVCLGVAPIALGLAPTLLR